MDTSLICILIEASQLSYVHFGLIASLYSSVSLCFQNQYFKECSKLSHWDQNYEVFQFIKTFYHN